MNRFLRIASVALLVGCSPSERTADAFARAPDTARAVVVDCEAGRRRSDCVEARAGLAMARREARMARYEEAF